MSAPMHTPGPWKASDRWGNFGDRNRSETDAPVGQVSRFSYSIADADGFCIAHCTGPLITCSAERSEANAKLMAAAPELLAALQWIADHGDSGEGGRPAYHDMRAHARAAIAKAKRTKVLVMCTDAPTSHDIREFNAYLRACTDSQVQGVYDKERAAGRDGYVELAKAEARNRRLPLGDDT